MIIDDSASVTEPHVRVEERLAAMIAAITSERVRLCRLDVYKVRAALNVRLERGEDELAYP